MQLPTRRAFGAAPLFALVCTLAGCAPTEAPPSSMAVAPTPPPMRMEQGDAGMLVLPDLMAYLVDPAAGVLLAAADLEASGDAEPRTVEAWQAVADAAVQLVQTSEMLAQPALALGRADWLKLAAALREDAATCGAAAGRHDASDLAEAGARIRATCQACHALYAPEVTKASALRVPQ